MSNDQNNIQKQRKNEKWVKVQNTQSINRFKHNIASLYRKWKTLDKLETLIEQKKGKNFFFLNPLGMRCPSLLAVHPPTALVAGVLVSSRE